MTSKELLSMLFERGNAMQSFWGFYITVAAALLAFFGSAQRSKILAVVLSLAFFGFACVNGNGMYDIAGQRQALFRLLVSFHPAPSATGTDAWSSPSTSQETKKNLLCASRPPGPFGVAAFHVVSDIAVLIAVWLLTLLPRESDIFKKAHPPN